MNERGPPELALTKEDVDEIVRSCNGRAVLIGGQALAIWAQYFGIAPVGVLGESVTSDVDFLGTVEVARDMAAALKSKGWRYWQPTMDDATSQTAKLSKQLEGMGVKQIDFLGSILGLETAGVMRRAVTLHFADGTRLQVLHPLDLLESRLKNLAVLPSKRNRHGIAQAQLGVDIVRAFFVGLVREGNTRLLLNGIERIASIAQDKTLSRVFHDYALNALEAVPIDQVPSEQFRSHRWPQILKRVESQRAAFAQRQSRARASGQTTKSREGPSNKDPGA